MNIGNILTTHNEAMSHLRLSVRLVVIAVHLLIGILLCGVFVRKSPTSFFRQRIVPWWLRTIGRIVGLRVTVYGKSAPPPVYITANHLSWLDILVIGGTQPGIFLSKREVINWPVIGLLARCAGTAFIQRGQGVSSAMQTISTDLLDGISTVVFPEGTTSSGSSVNRFFPRLFAAAIDNSIMIQPVSIAYPDPILKHKINATVAHYNETTFFINAITILKQPYIDAVLRYAEPITPSSDRKQLAMQAQQAVLKTMERSYLSHQVVQNEPE